MGKIRMQKPKEITVNEAMEQFVVYKTARGVKEVTARNYRLHFHSMSKFLDMDQPLSGLTQEKLDLFVVQMRESGLAHNSVCSYLRVFCSFLKWCNEKGYSAVTMKNIKQEETVKETYTDEELTALLKRPAASCTFCHFRCWVIVSFLMDTGCRAATVRNIRNSDVSLDSAQIIFRHTKSGNLQSIPISSRMIVILREYMQIRGGEGSDYLFCDEYGGMLSENALRKAITYYNKSCGVQKTSIPVDLTGAYSYHNHPAEKTHYSLSAEDVRYFFEAKQSVLKASDHRFEYQMTRTAETLVVDKDWVFSRFHEIRKTEVRFLAFQDLIDPDFDEYHATMMILSKELKFKYERKTKHK